MNLPLEKTLKRRVILMGAGNANLQCLLWLKENPAFEAILVNPESKVPYSAMVPGCIGGLFNRNEIEIDLVSLSARAGVTFLIDEVVSIDTEEKTVELKNNPAYFYDLLSINCGSVPKVSTSDRSLPARPLGNLLTEMEAIDREIAGKESYFLAIVGGGAGGCEIALSIAKRYQSHPQVKMSLIHDGPQLASAYFEAACRKAKIDLRLNQKAESLNVTYDKMIWATSAKALPWVINSPLAKTDEGFLKVNEFLQSLSHPDIFVTGDANHFTPHPLPKSGVYSVRQGPVLFHNLSGKGLKPYRPQKRFLRIYNTSDGEAIFHYGKREWKSAWALSLKNKIDRKWMAMFSMKKNKGMNSEEMRCGGCGSKVPNPVLENVFSRLKIPKSGEVIFGSGETENASLHRLPDKKLEVQSVDFFREFLPDTFLMGKVAALNALSDIHAMGASPFGALATVTLPLASPKVLEEKLFQLLSGSLEVFKSEGVNLLGGHTSEGLELAVGFSVTGYVSEGDYFEKGKLKAGESLILTKPVGTGALLMAHAQGRVNAESYQALIQSMLLSNRGAVSVLKEMGVKACTDVTGFGLVGHLFEMLKKSGVSARIKLETVPKLPQVSELMLGQGIRSTLQPGNESFLNWITGDTKRFPWIFDPQTSGGLLFSVANDKAAMALDHLKEKGYASAAVIGEVLSRSGASLVEALPE